ncbi:MAG TPA: hypothetical protein VES39_06270 [Rhodospirillales bacterium]|jgi:hypothetical protein|nr:hypothetical protein [Rhodospirillales bacterium]
MSRLACDAQAPGVGIAIAGRQRVCEIPDCINGQMHSLGVSRGATVATARFARGYGWYAAGLWRAKGEAEMWFVRTCDDRFHAFSDEEAAVGYFMGYAQALADGRFETAAVPSPVARHAFPVASDAIQPPPSTRDPS